MKNLLSELRIALVATVSLALLLCGVYPLVVWGIAQGAFPYKANGSLIIRDGKITGSELLAQDFADPKYFHPRPSSAGDTGYDGGSSGGSNLGPLSKKLIDSVEERVKAYRDENNLPATAPVPADAVTASASGLDPHISIQNALLQASRVAQARGMSGQAIIAEIKSHTQARDLGILGEPRVNVLTLNLALDAR
jgi:potassium-transporting ATPase KdpC subunit